VGEHGKRNYPLSQGMVQPRRKFLAAPVFKHDPFYFHNFSFTPLLEIIALSIVSDLREWVAIKGQMPDAGCWKIKTAPIVTSKNIPQQDASPPQTPADRYPGSFAAGN